MTKKIILKGGSLSKTYKVDKYVVKSISTKEEREYGFVRWYTQQKKLQRYSQIYPELFPKIYYVETTEYDTSIFIKYMKGFKDLKTIFSNDNLSENQLIRINESVWDGLNKLHSNKIKSISGLGHLYYQEEVVQKIKDAINSSLEFKNFYNFKNYNLNTTEVKGFQYFEQILEDFFKNLELDTEEYIFGNPTLENILYSFDEERAVFIDLYEESIIDTKFLDYSMVLQCSNSYYGYLNDNLLAADKNNVFHDLTIPDNFKSFNELFCEKLNKEDLKLINILEATQFFRMLPFKIKANETEKAKYFYVHGCMLLGTVFG
jgi:hypothetical protein